MYFVGNKEVVGIHKCTQVVEVLSIREGNEYWQVVEVERGVAEEDEGGQQKLLNAETVGSQLNILKTRFSSLIV